MSVVVWKGSTGSELVNKRSKKKTKQVGKNTRNTKTQRNTIPLFYLLRTTNVYDYFCKEEHSARRRTSKSILITDERSDDVVSWWAAAASRTMTAHEAHTITVAHRVASSRIIPATERGCKTSAMSGFILDRTLFLPISPTTSAFFTLWTSSLLPPKAVPDVGRKWDGQ